MRKNKKILLILAGVVVVLTGFVLLSQQPPTQEKEEGTPLAQEYPNNLIEGIVKAIDVEGKTLRLKARTFLIKTAQNDVMEKTIKFTEDTKCTISRIDTREEISCEFSEIKVSDNIVVGTLESTYDKVNELEEFTANRITKIVGE